MNEPATIRTYEEFWPYYLRQHSKAKTRCWHMAGTGAALAILIAAIVTPSWPLFAAAVIVGYAPAWLSHLIAEKNQPATFEHPVWSLISDFRMTALWLGGKLPRELEKAGVRPSL